jgi:hypothetical protein
MGIAIAMATWVSPCACAKQDVVTVRGPEGELRQRTGVVLDVNQERLLLDVNGREQKIPFDQVVEFHTALDPLAATADQLYAERKFELAFDEYGKGNEATTPAWMRRRLLAGRVRCATQMHAWVQAVENYLQLVQSDPRTQYFGEIPLVWAASSGDVLVARQVPQWLASNNRLERLIGASHGLSDQNRAASLQALTDLIRDPDPRIAALAVAQQWRSEPRPSREQLLQWESQLGQMPESLRAGPIYLLGNAWVAHDRQRAVLHLMKLPVLYGDQFELAGRSLSVAGDQLLKLEQVESAKIVLQELVDRHGGTPEADAAEQTLQNLPVDGRTGQVP